MHGLDFANMGIVHFFVTDTFLFEESNLVIKHVCITCFSIFFHIFSTICKVAALQKMFDTFKPGGESQVIDRILEVL